jgi:hypothetical protein
MPRNRLADWQRCTSIILREKFPGIDQALILCVNEKVETPSSKENREKVEPTAVVNYSRNKTGVDNSGQMLA